jgi:hypothetical protein
MASTARHQQPRIAIKPPQHVVITTPYPNQHSRRLLAVARMCRLALFNRSSSLAYLRDILQKIPPATSKVTTTMCPMSLVSGGVPLAVALCNSVAPQSGMAPSRGARTQIR